MDAIVERAIEQVRIENEQVHSRNWRLQVENMKLIEENKKLKNGGFDFDANRNR